MADRIEGLSIGLGLDTAEIDTGLKSLRRKLTLANSDMKATMSAFDKTTDSTGKFEAKLGVLNKRLDLSKESTQKAKNQYEKMTLAHGEGSKQADNARIAYNKEITSLNNLERDVKTTTSKFKDFENQQNASRSAFGKMSKAFDTAGGKFKQAGDGMQTAGKSMSLYLTAPIAGLAIASAKTAMNFESDMDRVGAIAGATGDEMDAMTESALKLGSETSKSASEVAKGMENMAAMGFTANEIIGAMPGVIAAAEASGSDMAQTAEVMASTLNIFGLKATDATKVADILAKTANISAASLTDMQYALKYAGPPADALGISLEETSAAIGIMTNAGMKGEQAGTTLRGALLGLLDPSEENSKRMEAMGIAITDNEGNFVGLSNLVENLSDSMEGQTDTQKAATISALVGKEAVSGMLSLMKAGPETIDKMTKSLENSAGASAEAAAKMKDNLKGALDELGGTVETAAITVGTILTPAIQKATGFIQGLVEKFQNASPEAQKMILVFAGIAAAAGPVLLVVGALASALGGALTLFGTVSGALAVVTTGAAAGTPAIGALATAFTVLTGPVGLVVAGLAAAAIGGAFLVNHLRKDAIPEVDRFGKGVSESTKEALGGFFKLSDGAAGHLMDLKINSGIITKETKDEMVEQFSAMNDQILTGMKKRHEDQLVEMNTFFLNSSVLTAGQEQQIIDEQKIRNDGKEVDQQHYEDRIKEILATAYKEKRELTSVEEATIDTLREEMNKNAVTYLSKNETESKVIMERMKQTAGDMSALQAAEVVKNSAKQRDGVIKDADKQYNESLAFIIKQRDESGTISVEEADKLIAEAKRKRDGVVGHAEDMHDDVVSEAKLQAEEHVNHVNWETGEILSKWDVYKAGVLKRVKDTNKNSMDDFKRWGTDYLTWSSGVHDKQREGWGRYNAGVLKRIKDTNKNSLGDFKRWGSDYLTWSKGFRGKAFEVWDEYKAGVLKRFNASTRDIGKGVNGVIGGINWVLGKLSVETKIPKWKVPQYAHGTNSHPGGLAKVSDGIGSNAGQELIQTPDGALSLSPKKESIVNLPKGSKVLSASKTKALGIPEYAFGIGDFLSETYGGIKNIGKKAVSKAFDIFDYLKNPSKLLDMALSAIGASKPSGTGFAASMAKGAFSTVKSGAVDYIKKQLAGFGIGGGSGLGFGSPFRKTSSYGVRIHPITGQRTMHNGDDYGAPFGTPIPAQAGGRVVYSGYHSLRGNYIKVQSGNMARIYQHNTRNLVGVGDMVKAGQAVGQVGSTGASTGAHLHYEVLRNGSPINPAGFANGGLITKQQLAMVGEGNKPEMVIPLDPAKRTNAMKLLALTGKMLGVGGKGGSVSPSTMQTPIAGNDNQVVKLLQELLAVMQTSIATPQPLLFAPQMNNRTFAEETYEIIDGLIQRKKGVTKTMRGG